MNINDILNTNILNLDDPEILNPLIKSIGDTFDTKVKSCVVFSSLIMYPSIQIVKYKYNITVNEQFENNKNIIYDKLTESYYYNLSLDKKQNNKILDIIENINCNYEITKLYFLYNLEIKCDINKVALPLFNMYYTPINFLIKIDKQDIINIDLSFDAYTLRNSLRIHYIKNVTDITNNENMVFKKGQFVGYNN